MFLLNGPDSPFHSVLGSHGPQLLWKYYGSLTSFRLSESPKLELDSPASSPFQGTKIQIALQQSTSCCIRLFVCYLEKMTLKYFL